MTTKTTTARRRFNIKFGIYIPGAFAALVKKSTEDGASIARIETAVRKLQSFGYWRCACSPESQRPLDLFTRRQVRQFADMAKKEPYHALYTTIEHILAAVPVTCPACGRSRSLDLTQRNS